MSSSSALRTPGSECRSRSLPSSSAEFVKVCRSLSPAGPDGTAQLVQMSQGGEGVPLPVTFPCACPSFRSIPSNGCFSPPRARRDKRGAPGGKGDWTEFKNHNETPKMLEDYEDYKKAAAGDRRLPDGQTKSSKLLGARLAQPTTLRNNTPLTEQAYAHPSRSPRELSVLPPVWLWGRSGSGQGAHGRRLGRAQEGQAEGSRRHRRRAVAGRLPSCARRP